MKLAEKNPQKILLFAPIDTKNSESQVKSTLWRRTIRQKNVVQAPKPYLQYPGPFFKLNIRKQLTPAKSSNIEKSRMNKPLSKLEKPPHSTQTGPGPSPASPNNVERSSSINLVSEQLPLKFQASLQIAEPSQIKSQEALKNRSLKRVSFFIGQSSTPQGEAKKTED